ncbi:MAG: hypothetical protein AB1349_12935, partial [Elusimicrobiota bacterium]
KWVKWKQRSRSKIEGFIGVSKVHRGLERLLFKNEELNIRLGLLAMNLSTGSPYRKLQVKNNMIKNTFRNKINPKKI